MAPFEIPSWKPAPRASGPILTRSRGQFQLSKALSSARHRVMRTLTKIVVGSLITGLTYCVVAATSLPFAKAEDEIGAAAAKGRVLTVKELNSIYEGRSWRWTDGAGYFGAPNRVFTAWLNKGAKATYADGSWSVSDQGRLCYRATWHALTAKSMAFNNTASTCFEHRTDDKIIYQRMSPKGKWYVFSHIPALPADEVQKLQPGDHVSEDYKTNKRYVAEHARRQKRK
jgi:hypothetical protein